MTIELENEGNDVTVEKKQAFCTGVLEKGKLSL